MKEITFPNFNLVFNIDSIAINIGGISIYWYAILIVSAFIIGIIFCKNDDGKLGIKENIKGNLHIFIWFYMDLSEQ